MACVNERVKSIYRNFIPEKLRVMLRQAVYILPLVLYEIRNIKYTFQSGTEDRGKYQLRRAAHRLEKSLLFLNRRVGAGIDAALSILDGLEDNKLRSKLSENEIMWFCSVLKQYQTLVQEDIEVIGKRKVDNYLAERVAKLSGRLDLFFSNNSGFVSEEYYMLDYLDGESNVSYEDLVGLFKQRHSPRHFSKKQVGDVVILKAIEIARYTPSACNRQGVTVTTVRDKKILDQLLDLQGGIVGFEQYMHTVLVISASREAYPNYNERHMPFIDGSLFVMNLIWGFQVQGVYSICLNWSYTSPASDKRAHGLLQLPDSDEIVVLLATGYPDKGIRLPNSCKRSAADFLRTCC